VDCDFIDAMKGATRQLFPLAQNAMRGAYERPSLPVRTVRDLVRLAKEKPGQITFGSSGVASSSHLSGELFKMLAGVDMVHVPYKGST
jgi:Tripartite tricarboxylate transporter family receptor